MWIYQRFPWERNWPPKNEFGFWKESFSTWWIAAGFLMECHHNTWLFHIKIYDYICICSSPVLFRDYFLKPFDVDAQKTKGHTRWATTSYTWCEITPISKVISAQLPNYFRPFIRMKWQLHSTHNFLVTGPLPNKDHGMLLPPGWLHTLPFSFQKNYTSPKAFSIPNHSQPSPIPPLNSQGAN